MTEEKIRDELEAIIQHCNEQHEQMAKLSAASNNPVKAEIRRRISDRHKAEAMIEHRDAAFGELDNSSGDVQFAAILSLLFIHRDKSPEFGQTAISLATCFENPPLQSLAITAIGNIYADTSSPKVIEILRNLRETQLIADIQDALELSMARIQGVPPVGDKFQWIREMHQKSDENRIKRETKSKELREKFGDDFPGFL